MWLFIKGYFSHLIPHVIPLYFERCCNISRTDITFQKLPNASHLPKEMPLCLLHTICEVTKTPGRLLAWTRRFLWCFFRQTIASRGLDIPSGVIKHGNGKSPIRGGFGRKTTDGSFSIAMFDYQRVETLTMLIAVAWKQEVYQNVGTDMLGFSQASSVAQWHWFCP